MAIGGALVVLSPVLQKLPKTAAITAGVLTVALVQMAFDAPADLVLLEAVVALVGLKVITMKEALDGFRSEGVVAVGVMCAVAKGVQVTGGLQLITKYLLGAPQGYEMALLRLVAATMVRVSTKLGLDALRATRCAPLTASGRAHDGRRAYAGHLCIHEQYSRLRDDDAHRQLLGGLSRVERIFVAHASFVCHVSAIDALGPPHSRAWLPPRVGVTPCAISRACVP